MKTLSGPGAAGQKGRIVIVAIRPCISLKEPEEGIMDILLKFT